MYGLLNGQVFVKLEDVFVCTDETSDASVTNGRSEVTNLNSDVCGNGGMSSRTATSNMPVCDPEVCCTSAVFNLQELTVN